MLVIIRLPPTLGTTPSALDVLSKHVLRQNVANGEIHGEIRAPFGGHVKN